MKNPKGVMAGPRTMCGGLNNTIKRHGRLKYITVRPLRTWFDGAANALYNMLIIRYI
jgi:hypothetical protein